MFLWMSFPRRSNSTSWENWQLTNSGNRVEASITIRCKVCATPFDKNKRLRITELQYVWASGWKNVFTFFKNTRVHRAEAFLGGSALGFGLDPQKKVYYWLYETCADERMKSINSLWAPKLNNRLKLIAKFETGA